MLETTSKPFTNFAMSSPLRGLAKSWLVIIVLMMFPSLSFAGGQGRLEDWGPLEVKIKDRDLMVGKARFRKDKLEIKIRGRVKKFDPANIEWLSDLHELPGPSKLDLARAERDYKRKLEMFKVEDAPGWLRLGKWCRDRGLREKAQEAFRKALKLDPENRDANRELGRVKHNGSWLEAAKVADEKWNKVNQKDKGALLKFGEWASKLGIPQGQKALDLVLQKNIFDKRGLRAMARYTSVYRHKTKIRFPLAGRWLCSPDPTKHHQKKAYAVYAMDILKIDGKGKKYSGSGRNLSDYFTWDEPVYAVADGVVVDARDGFPDLPIGARLRPEKHNGLSIRHEQGEHSFYVHLKKGSLTVKVGDQVKQGQLIARIGNSGGTSRPHLHFAMAIPSALSIPWYCENYTLLIAGARIPVKVGRPREGMIIDNAWDNDQTQERKKD